MKIGKAIGYLVGAAAIYAMLSFFISIQTILAAPQKGQAYLGSFAYLWWVKLLLIALLWVLIYLFNRPPLDIQDKKVGHGQHGDAAFMDEDEKRETYTRVPFGNERKPGFLVGGNTSGWLVDTSDQTMMLLAPPSAGKSTGVYIPNIKYNGAVNRHTNGNGASMLIVDIKGDLYRKTAAELQACGYRTPILDLRLVENSYQFNIMNRVNKEIDLYLAATTRRDRAKHYGMAERYAKITADAIITSAKAVSSEGSEYFNDSAKGLVIGLVLLVAEYSPPAARHIMSVFDIIIQLNAQDEQSALAGVQTTKLAIMMKNIKNRRVQSYVGAATGADIRTMLNIFSSALAKLVRFVDAELEQMLCGHSAELDANAFIENPTAIYLICPDENPTRHFLASLFIRFFANELIELAETDYKGVLPRQFFMFLDEFGNIPSIQHVVSLFSAVRSRNGRVLVALQSLSQLLDKYNRDQADIIRDTCQMLMFTYLAPAAESTATTLSKMLGNETVLTGTTSYSRGVSTVSSQMVGRPLMAPSQIITMPKEQYIVMKGSHNPMKTQMQGYWKYLKLEDELKTPPPELDFKEVILVSARFIEYAASGHSVKLGKGMFDDG